MPLIVAVALLASVGLLAMYSSGYDHGTRFVDHARNMVIAATVMFLVAQIPPQRLMELAVPLYTFGVVLLIAVAIFGITKKGARRWINVGVVIQPSEILKIAMPLMLAWWFQKREGQLHALEFIVATDNGMMHKLRTLNPGKTFYEAPTAGNSATCKSCAHCPWMAMNGLAGLAHVLEHGTNEIHVDPALGLMARRPIDRMLAFTAALKNGQPTAGLVPNIGAA